MKRKLRAADGTIKKLDEILQEVLLQGTYRIRVSANGKQTARWADVEVRSTSVTM